MIRSALVLLLGASLAFAQTRKEFEVASIKPSPDQPQAQIGAGIRIDGSQVGISYFSLRDCISLAYQVRVNQIVGPDWLPSQRFEIAAKLPEGAAQSDVPQMLQALLVDRFQLKSHREMRELPVYVLEVAKTGLKIAETASADAVSGQGPVTVAAAGSAAGIAINYGNGSSFTLGANNLETKKLTMNTLADALTRFLDRPVVDMTNLSGAYDITIEMTPEDRMAFMIRAAVSQGLVLPPQALALLDNAPGNSLANGLKKAGLSLEARRAPLEVLVIDQMQKTPTEN